MTQEDSKKKELEISNFSKNIENLACSDTYVNSPVNSANQIYNGDQINEIDPNLTGKSPLIKRKRGRPRKTDSEIYAKEHNRIICRRDRLLRKLNKLGCSERDLQIAQRVASGESLKTVANDHNLDYSTLRHIVVNPKHVIYQAINSLKQSLAEGYADLADLILVRARSEIATGKAENAYKFSMLGLELIRVCEPHKSKEVAEVIVPFFEDVTDKSTSS